MPNVDNTTQTKRANLKIPVDVHREIKIEAAHIRKDMGDLIAAAWEAYKAAVPEPWRDEPKPKRKAS